MSKCITTDQLTSMLNVDKFNEMMNNTTNKVNSFMDSYIKEQKDIKNKVNEKQSSLELDRYRQTAINIKRTMLEKHQHMMKLLNREFEILKNQLQNEENTKDLFDMLVKQNAILRKTVEKQIHTIEISDRKAYYEYEENSSAGWWADHLKTKYFYLIILIMLGIFMKKRYGELKLWGTLILLFLYPFIIFYIVNLFEGIYDWIKNNSRIVYYGGL